MKKVIYHFSGTGNSMEAAERVFKLFIAILSLFGVLGMILGHVFSGPLDLISYFTQQSNIIVSVVLIYGALTPNKSGALKTFIRGGATLWISVTGLVYAAIIAPTAHFTGIAFLAVVIHHYIVPLAVILDWLIFEKKGDFKFTYPLYWICYPLIYCVVSLIRGAITGFYPYWFLNPTQSYPSGAGSVGMMIVLISGLLVFFIILGYVIFLIDRSLGKRAAKSRSKNLGSGALQ